MPLGGALAYDTLMTYTFINFIGYGGEKTGYLSTMLRERDVSLYVDFEKDFSNLGAKGDGILGHFIGKIYLIVECLYELCYLYLLVIIACKVLIHSITKLQTK